jgi:pilus assembly protein Flp/PilA
LHGIIKAAGEFGRDQSGASIVEYALMLALITIVCITGMTVLGAKINSFFSSFSTTL